MNNDISQVKQQLNLFNNKNYKCANEEMYAGRKSLWGYIGPTSDKDIARGQYLVFVNELNGAPVLARLLYNPCDLGPNGTGGSPKKLELHQPVLLIPLNETGEYGIAHTYIPLTDTIEQGISNYIVGSGGDPLEIRENPNDSQYTPSITMRQNGEAGYNINPVIATGLTIAPFDMAETPYNWTQLGSIETNGYDGNRFQLIAKDNTVSSASSIQLVDGVNKTKVDKSKSELFKFYHLTKYKLANSTKRLYEYKDGKIVPGGLLSQIRTFSGNFGETGREIITFIDRITGFLNQADGIINAISDFIEWFDGDILSQVTDLISIIGLPTGIKIGNVVNIGLSFNGDQPIGASVRFNVGNKFVNLFLEGVANSLISDFIGDTSLNGLIEKGLSALGINIKGKDKPDETQSVNNLNPKIPPKRKSKSLIDVIEGIGNIIPGSFGNYLKSFTNVSESIGLTNNGVIQLDNPTGEFYGYLDYSRLNLDLATPDGRLSSHLSTLGYDYAPFTIKAIKNFELTQNPIYTLMSILPLVPLPDKVWIILFIYYATQSENSYIYLIKEFIEPHLSPWSNNNYLIKLANLKHEDILTTLEELDYPHLDFKQLILNPSEELKSISLDTQLLYYFNELLAGKILNYLRGCLLITSGYDITLDLELYSKLNLLIKEIYYA